MVKCAECGFLAIRNNRDNTWEEVKEDFRREAQNSIQAPYCFVRAIDMWRLLDEVSVQEIISQDRDCHSFFPWSQGFTPKEHQEMVDRQRMLDREDRIHKGLREWQLQQEQRAEQRHKEQMVEAKKAHFRELVVLGGVVTLAIIITTLLGSAIEAQWIPEWFGLNS